MAKNKNTAATENQTTANEQNTKLEGGAYEIIQGRLLKQGNELRKRLGQLNEARKEVFGAVETTLIANDRITTKNNCIASDIIALGKHCLFGYNVYMGLKTEVKVSDVFSMYDFSDNSFHEKTLDIIKDARFEDDFANMYKYYRHTNFVKFGVIGAYLYMVFRIGKSHRDIKVFKWLIKDDESLQYVDDRSAAEFRMPEQYEFEWIRTRREMHREGEHPHVSIQDRLFVETVGGDLTIKIEDNTSSGRGIYEEDVAYKEQTLDDGEYMYADLGNLIAIKIRPYKEDFRYFVYNEKMQEVKRVDTLEDSAVLLPDGHGLIFSDGYYLQTGEFKQFDKQLRGMQFEKRIVSPNGEDYLFVFYQPELSEYVLMSYNVIEQKVATPILCNGYTCFTNGELCYFRAETDPTKHHVIQIWQTPYSKEELITTADKDNLIFKIGNKDIVRAMAESQEILILLNKEDTYANLYLDLVKNTNNVLDSYYWIHQKETYQLNEPLLGIREAAASAIDEFEKVQRIRLNTQAEVERIAEKADDLFTKTKRQRFDSVDQYVKALANFRALRGEVISAKELRYVDTAWLDQLEVKAGEQTDKLSEACVQFLLEENALKPYHEKVAEQSKIIEQVSKVMQANELEKNLAEIGDELELLIDIVSNLKIEDATHTTRIIDSISGIFVSLNRQKARLKNKKKELLSVEAVAEFNAQFKLLEQSIINYLDISDSPQKCDEYLTKVMVSLEELEGKFVDFEDFTLQIADKRDEIYNAFESKKLNLVESLNRRATSLQGAAERIFKGVRNRLKNFKTVAEINSYFAADLMVDKVRDIIKQLVTLEDTVKADDIQGQLKSIKEEAIRQLKDRQELFVEGENIIKMGRHHFSVNTQPLDLTIVNKNKEMCFHLTGTNFFEPITNTDFLQTKSVWNQDLISENKNIYRSEFLAYQLFNANGEIEKSLKEAIKNKDEKQLLQVVQKFAAPRYSEGYVKGVHDNDAALILQGLLDLTQQIDLLRYPPNARACASLYWHLFENEADKDLFNNQLKGVGVILQLFPNTHEYDYLIENLQAAITNFIETNQLFSIGTADLAAEYLFYELTRDEAFIISKDAADLYRAFNAYLKDKKFVKKYEQSLSEFEKEEQVAAKFTLITNWLKAYIEQEDKGGWNNFIKETATILLLNNFKEKQIVNVSTQKQLKGLAGSHEQIAKENYELEYNTFMQKMRMYQKETVPKYEHYNQLKKQLNDEFKQQLRLDEFKPRVLSSFVRNQLIDKVYLPIIGDNLAKQIGAVGDNKRTDLMGMLLLISPPGYGKTTLMEYICSRLGLIFMKINGPAIGHSVTSLDPSEAPNAAAKEEMSKLNLAFEMGDNVMIYVDDIQHCHPEFLQKFISLCDGQRKIEGVYKGVSKTYDLRGKKICVVMAGNPYTESGEKFQIPDMLANRADTYNLGDIIGDSAEVFKLSYLENCLTSNAVLSRLAGKSMKDVITLIHIATTDEREGVSFEANHTADELSEYISVLKKLIKVRDIVLRVNQEYIASAAQEDQYRTEPSFKLQGSYRDMNKLAEKIVPIMNEQELQTLILSHYENESQTLTSGAEANLLKFKEINELISESEEKRWKEIKETFRRNLILGGAGEDRIGQIVGQMQAISQGLDGYLDAFVGGLEGIQRALGVEEEPPKRRKKK